MKISSFLFILITALLSVNTLRLFLKSNATTLPDAKPQVLGISDTKAVSLPDEPEYQTYVVKKGDTLFNIAQQFAISWTTLATLNNISSPFTVSPGQKLKIPKP